MKLINGEENNRSMGDDDMDFVYAKQLKKEYKTYGSFYQLLYGNGEKISCRNVLEILEKSYCNNLINKNRVDAIVVMMNPGKSRPKKKNYKIPVIKENDIIKNQKVNINLIETIPDITQYQIMRMMKCKKWRHVRIINLSDCRESNSNKFYEKIESLKNNDQCCIHSIFSKKRGIELNECFKNNKKLNLIVAWGINDKLNELINQAISSQKLNKRIGNAKGNNAIHYYHAGCRTKADRIDWLQNILQKI